MSSKNKQKLAQRVLGYLKRNRLMTLGTSHKNRPWGATVFFAHDRRFNFLFYSRPDTRHCQNISKNPLVSVVINQDWGEGRGVKGLQILGRASAVPQKSFRRYYALYRSRFKWADEFPDHKMYIIRPLELWYIDEKFFGHFYRVKVGLRK